MVVALKLRRGGHAIGAERNGAGEERRAGAGCVTWRKELERHGTGHVRPTRDGRGVVNDGSSRSTGRRGRRHRRTDPCRWSQARSSTRCLHPCCWRHRCRSAIQLYVPTAVVVNGDDALLADPSEPSATVTVWTEAGAALIDGAVLVARVEELEGDRAGRVVSAGHLCGVVDLGAERSALGGDCHDRRVTSCR